MSPAARSSNPLALAVLTLLDERPMHPYEMSTTLRERRKEESIKLNYGSLYSVVASLEKAGLVAVRETVRDGNRPERTVYALTEAGRARMTDWLSDLISIPAKEFTQFEAALSLIGALPPDEAARLLELRLGGLQLQRSAAEGVRASLPASFPRVFLIEDEFQKAMLDTQIDFVRGLLRDLRSERMSGYKVWKRMHELRDAGMPSQDVPAALASELADELTWMEEMRPS